MAVLEADKCKNTAFLYGSETIVGRQIIRDLKKSGWNVIEKEIKNNSKESFDQQVSVLLKEHIKIDLLVLGYDEEITAVDIWNSQEEWDQAVEKYEQNINRNLILIHRLLPLMDAGDGKRICYVNSIASSNNLCRDTKHYLNHMIGAARNMQAAILKNRLQPEGYTFRIFGYEEGERKHQDSFCVVDYFLKDRSIDPGSNQHSDEFRLVMRDSEGREVPW